MRSTSAEGEGCDEEEAWAGAARMHTKTPKAMARKSEKEVAFALEGAMLANLEVSHLIRPRNVLCELLKGWTLGVGR